jgi:RNA polymerase sigma-70 factor (ECF subfamily)
MKNTADTEDMVQETFLRLLSSGVGFVSEEHEKAWLIVTASNLCKDTLKKWWRKTEDIDDPALGLQQPPFEIDAVLDAIMKLPADQKCAVYMYYYEGYSTAEIAGYLGCPQATVRSRLSRARKTLKHKLGGDF